MGEELVHLLLVGWAYIAASFLQIALIQVVHGDPVALKSEDDIILNIAVLGHLAVLVRQFPNRGALGELSHDMGAWHHSFIESLAPIQCCLQQTRIAALQGNFEHGSQETSAILDDIGHIRDETGRFECPAFQVSFEEDQDLGVSLIECCFVDFHVLTLGH